MHATTDVLPCGISARRALAPQRAARVCAAAWQATAALTHRLPPGMCILLHHALQTQVSGHNDRLPWGYDVQQVHLVTCGAAAVGGWVILAGQRE